MEKANLLMNHLNNDLNIKEKGNNGIVTVADIKIDKFIIKKAISEGFLLYNIIIIFLVSWQNPRRFLSLCMFLWGDFQEQHVLDNDTSSSI